MEKNQNYLDSKGTQCHKIEIVCVELILCLFNCNHSLINYKDAKKSNYFLTLCGRSKCLVSYSNAARCRRLLIGRAWRTIRLARRSLRILSNKIRHEICFDCAGGAWLRIVRRYWLPPNRVEMTRKRFTLFIYYNINFNIILIKRTT